MKYVVELRRILTHYDHDVITKSMKFNISNKICQMFVFKAFNMHFWIIFVFFYLLSLYFSLLSTGSIFVIFNGDKFSLLCVSIALILSVHFWILICRRIVCRLLFQCPSFTWLFMGNEKFFPENWIT